MTQYRRQETNGESQYFDAEKNKPVAADKVPTAIKEELDLANPGEIIDSESVTKNEGDGVIGDDKNEGDDSEEPSELSEEQKAELAAEEERDADRAKVSDQTNVSTVPKPSEKVKMDDGKEAPKSSNPYRQPAPSTEKGFGFPRRNGKTVDIFDLKTVHSELRYIAGLPVPLSAKNYKEKSDAEIYDRLVELDLVATSDVYGA